MKQKTIKEVQGIWDKFSHEESWKSFSVDHSLHKNMLLAFQPGPCYCWLLNVKSATFEIISPEIEKILGYPIEEITFQFLLEKVHPDDTPYLLNFEVTLADFFSRLPNKKRFRYKIQYDFRLQKSNGDYIRILNQMVMVEYDITNNLIRTFGIQTDISLLKTTVRPTLSFIALQNEDPSYIDVDIKNIYKPTRSILSKREKEVLALMLSGYISKEISSMLNISKFTVDSHRKKMLEKTESKSISEMINKSIIHGWL